MASKSKRIDTLLFNGNYEKSFLNEHGKDIKRLVLPDYTSTWNGFILDACPNVEEFIIDKNTQYTFKDGILYSTSMGKRSIMYVTKKVKELHIDADISDISYWHGVEKVTVAEGNHTFCVQNDMLLSRRKSSLFFVCSKVRNVIVPEGVTAIHARAFEYCTDLKKIVFPASYDWKEWYRPFDEQLLIPSESMRTAEIEIKGGMYKYENQMVIRDSVSLPDVMLYLGDDDLCHVPDDVYRLSSMTNALSNIQNYEVGEQNKELSSVDGVVLDKEKTKLVSYPQGRKEFVVPDSVTVIGTHSVNCCDYLSEAIVPAHVETVENDAFVNCKNLTSIKTENPKTVMGTVFSCGKYPDMKEEPVDEKAIIKEVEKALKEMHTEQRPAKKAKKTTASKAKDEPTQVIEYSDDLSLSIPKSFKRHKEKDDEGNVEDQLRWGRHKDDTTGEMVYSFTASVEELDVDPLDDGSMPSADDVIDQFVEESSNGLTSRSFVQHGDHPWAFVSIETPLEVPMGIFGTIVLNRYIVDFWTVVDNKIAQVCANGFRNEGVEQADEDEEILYEKIIELANGITLCGEKVDLGDLAADKLSEEIKPVFADSESDFSFQFPEPEEPKPEVRFDDNDSRKVIVDDKWSFRLPWGIDLQFNSEHVGIMGDNETANYVLEGVERSGKYYFDFELHQRYDTGMDKDIDVLGCRYDNDVSSGNADQKILVDGDDLFVDIVKKGIFLFRGMIIIRVRGDNIRPWDFTMGLNSMDQDQAAHWDEVKPLMNQLAESIKLEGAGSSKPKKKSKRSSAAVSDPDFIVKDGTLVKYIGNDADITIPDGVSEIADNTFSGSTFLHSVTVPEGVKRLGRRSFENCFNLEHINLPDSLEEIGGYAFVDCHKLQEVYLSDKITSLGDSTFSECFVLKDVKIPKKIKVLEGFVFKNCDAFEHIVVPNGVQSIEALAFAGCDNLEYLFVPNSVTELQINMLNGTPFDDDPKLVIYTPSGSATETFAKEHGLTYKNAARGTVTAENIKPYVTKSASSTKSQKQFDEVRDALKGLDEQAAQYENAFLSDGDQEKLDELKDKLSDLHDKFEEGASKFSDYFEQKEERERKEKEERQRKIAEAKAKGKSDDDEVNMFVILTNEEKMGQKNRKQDDFYKLYDDDFPAYNKKDTLALRKKVKAEMKSSEYRKNCRVSFMSRSIEDRFTVSTKNYFSVTDVPDFEMKADEALENTKDWYEKSELPEVKKLMDKNLADIKDDITGQLQSVEPEWTNWRTAKKYLKVRLIYKWGDQGSVIKDSCSMFQYERRFCPEYDPDGFDIVVEVFLTTEGMVKMTATVLNAMPFYWGVSYEDIWKTAIKNEIVDEVDADRKCNYLATDSLNEIKKKYPDAKTLKEQERAAKKSASAKFVKDIQSLYSNAENNADSEVSKADIKKIIDNNFKDPDELLECGSYILKEIDRSKMAVLYDLIENEADAQKLYKDIPKKLSEDINAVYEKTKIERQEKERKERIDKVRNAVASTKESIEQLKSSIKENADKLADLNSELDEKHAELEKEHEKYDAFLEEEKKKWRVRNDELQEEIADSKLYIEKLQEQISGKKRELSSLSFLQFGRKKELTKIIEGLTNEVQKEQSNRDQLVSKRNSAEKGYHDKVDTPQNIINSMASRVSKLKGEIDTLTIRIGNDKKSLEEKTAKLPELEEELAKVNEQ